MANKRTYDFCSEGAERRDDERCAPAPQSASEFFIDGWDAYGQWLDRLRDRLDPASGDGKS